MGKLKSVTCSKEGADNYQLIISFLNLSLIIWLVSPLKRSLTFTSFVAIISIKGGINYRASHRCLACSDAFTFRLTVESAVTIVLSAY